MTPIVIAGPTASGKSALALALADAIAKNPAYASYTPVIVCGDSRQIYAGMRIGAAGPSDAELQQAKHIGYGEIAPTFVFDAGKYVSFMDAHVQKCQANQEWPIVVGGAGLYLRAWRQGLDDLPSRDDEIRQELEKICQEKGAPALHDELKQCDPLTAAKLSPNDGVRIVRALEIYRVTGQPASSQRTQPSQPRFQAHWIVLDTEPAWLNPRIDLRARMMFDDGLREEAIQLRDVLGPEHRLLTTMGYEEALQWADQKCSRDEAIQRTAQRQRQYAKRQRTWFRGESIWQRQNPSDPQLVASLRRDLFREQIVSCVFC